MIDLHDPTACIYSMTLLVALYGAFLFLWWWEKKGRASAVFAYVTFMFIGEILESSLSLYARYLYFKDNHDGYYNFVNSWIWPGRKIITLIAFLLIVVHMSYKVFVQKNDGNIDR